MTLTAETNDPKFETRLVLKQSVLSQTMGSMLRRNTVIKIILVSTEPYRRERIMKAITLLDGSLPANPVNDRRIADAVTLKSTFCLP